MSLTLLVDYGPEVSKYTTSLFLNLELNLAKSCVTYWKPFEDRSMTHVMMKKICKNLNIPIEIKLSTRYALYPVVLVCAMFVSLTFLYLSLLC
jgi:hypothetical protein